MDAVFAEDLPHRIKHESLRGSPAKILSRNLCIRLNPSSLPQMSLQHFIVCDKLFPGNQMFFMDYILLQGRDGLLDYSMLMPNRETNYNINYSMFLKDSGYFMRIKQLADRNCFYFCDGKTNKDEYVWIILEDTSVPGSPMQFSPEMVTFVLQMKLKAFERYEYAFLYNWLSADGKLDHKINASSVPKLSKPLDAMTLSIYGSHFQSLFQQKRPSEWENFKVFHILEKHGQNETISSSFETNTHDISQYSMYLNERYGWRNVDAFEFAWTLEILPEEHNDLSMFLSHKGNIRFVYGRCETIDVQR